MTTYEDTAAFFDGTAGLYDDWFLKDVHYMRLLASIIERLLAYSPRRIIELGCGTGNLSVLIGKHFPEAEITGVDISRDLLNQASAKCASQPNVSLIEADIMATVKSIPDDASVVSNYALHHLTDPDKQRLCGSLGRVMAPGNAVVIGDVCYPPPHEAPGSSEQRRASAVLDLFHARARYYLEVVGLDRCAFEVEHLPLVLQRQREHLVEQGFWSGLAADNGLTVVADEPVGPSELGNFLIELTRDAV